MPLDIVSPSAAIRQTAFAHSAAVTKRVPVVIGTRAFLPVNSAGANEETNYIYEAEVREAPKATGGAWTPGSPVYWHAANGNFTHSASGAVLCGFSLGHAASGDTETPLFKFDTFAAVPA